MLALPAAAQAHTVTPSVDCSAATLVYESTAGTTLSYEIVLNGVSAVKDRFVIPASDVSGTLTVPYSAPTGPFTVTVNAKFSTGETGTVTKSMTCTTPVPPATAPPPPPAASPPPPPDSAVTAPPPPASAVAGEQVSVPPSRARLAARSACRARVVRITVAGRRMRDIVFAINGRRVRTVTVRAGQRSVRVSLPMRNRRVSQVVTARVRFRNGARPRTLRARTARCAQAAVQPTFTG
ncbi:MAG TPA: hypothetical protein VHF51_01095 [Solirubrobacteraceae bacterium]|nr:hypothetical protein [Solirubrobacteraceae bacterium]